MFLLLLFKTDHFLILSYIKFQNDVRVLKRKVIEHIVSRRPE